MCTFVLISLSIYQIISLRPLHIFIYNIKSKHGRSFGEWKGLQEFNTISVILWEEGPLHTICKKPLISQFSSPQSPFWNVRKEIKIITLIPPSRTCLQNGIYVAYKGEHDVHILCLYYHVTVSCVLASKPNKYESRSNSLLLPFLVYGSGPI